eukprot:675144-Pleurochrysis_carterae.AAC.7
MTTCELPGVFLTRAALPREHADKTRLPTCRGEGEGHGGGGSARLREWERDRRGARRVEGRFEDERVQRRRCALQSCRELRRHAASERVSPDAD